MTAVRLRAGDYEATFLPGAGMLGTSLRHRGSEYVARPEPIARSRAGSMTAIALMHPWANRLATRHYRAAGRDVDLSGLDLPTDEGGRPLHGNLRAAPFVVDRVGRDRIDAHLVHENDPTRFAAFPFPHRLEVQVRLDARRGLGVTTTIRPTGPSAVPIAFGWHPYLRLPGSRRSHWRLDLPACDRIALDERHLPTGTRSRVAHEHLTLTGRALDDHFALRRAKTIAIDDGTRRVSVRFGRGFPFAQIYAPPRRRLVAIEPMAAPIDGLRSGAAPVVGPDAHFSAVFSIAVDAD